MKDLARGTSSGSTKLIHGGLRYLEHYEFRLVREALMEREVLWAHAPHIIWPLRFVAAASQGDAVRRGSSGSACSFTTISAAASGCPGTRTLNLETDPAASRSSRLRKAFEYSDCWVNDARLVRSMPVTPPIAVRMIRTRTKVVGPPRRRLLDR